MLSHSLDLLLIYKRFTAELFISKLANHLNIQIQRSKRISYDIPTDCNIMQPLKKITKYSDARKGSYYNDTKK